MPLHASHLTDAQVDRIMDTGVAILAMRKALDDTPFEEDDWLDVEQQEELRGSVTGRQMRRWVRRVWCGGERGFIIDNDLLPFEMVAA